MCEPSLGWTIRQTTLIFKPSQQCKTPLSLPALPSSSLSPPWTSFLLINALFLPAISNLSRHVPDFVFCCSVSWHLCGNNESEGTCFLQVPIGCVLTPPEDSACVGSPVLPGGVRGSTQTPAELSHPLSPLRFLLPDELWRAGLIVCARQTNVGSRTGLSKILPTPPSSTENMEPVTKLQMSSQKGLRGSSGSVMCATLSQYY